jgi:hypothetical protein
MSLTKVSYSMITGAPVNVMDYGAVGDGTTDDTSAIVAAFAASASVYFPAGTYLLKSKITTTNAYIRGDSKNTTTLLTEVDGDVAISANLCKAENITFESNLGLASASSDSGLYAAGPSHITDCIFKQYSNAGFQLSAAYWFQIQSTQFTYCKYGVEGLVSPGWGDVTCTSLNVLSSSFDHCDRGWYQPPGNRLFNASFDTCLFDYCDIGLECATNDIALKNCWFEHGTTAGARVSTTFLYVENCAEKGANDLIESTIILGVTDERRGYVEVEAKQSKVSTRSVEFGNGGGRNETGVYEGLTQFGSGGKLIISPTAYVATICQNFYVEQFKTSVVFYRTYDDVFTDYDTGFTFTKLATGKYHIDFNRQLQVASMTAQGLVNGVTLSPLTSYGASNTLNVTCIPVNPASTTNYQVFSAATGAVIIVTDASNALTDADVSFSVSEVVADIFSAF